ncbi:MAG: ATP-binding protein [Anaerolineae bacterium]|nr:ATP-binding protein [Anaerolineae bacterium]
MKRIDEVARQIRDATSKVNTDISSSIEPPDLASFGVGKPECPLCKGLGYVSLDVPVDHPDFGRLFPCTCRISELQSQRSETLRMMGNLKFLERFTFETFCPEGHGISPDRQQNLRRAYEGAMAYARHPKGWLLLRGGYGCGKTHLAAAIANASIAQGRMPFFVTVPDLLDHLRASFAPNTTEGYSERFEMVRNAPLLILDDLGTEQGTAWALEKLFQLLNHRYMTRLPTVITTNHDLEELDLRLRSRLADSELVEIITILAPDFRQAGVEHTESDLNTLAFYTDMTFDTFELRQGELDREQATNLVRAVEVARTYAENPVGMLLLTGTYGCGKTHLAAAIANTRTRLGHTALFVVVPDLLDHLRAAFNPQSSLSYDKRFEEVKRAPFLVLDDLGTESATPWAQEKLFQLFNYRYVAKLPTVITTARELEKLDPKLRTRLLDTRRCTPFAILAPSYRGTANLPKSKSGRSRGTGKS